ncbi:MAG: type II toxin-antitoxin system RelE/ParE family toxin [Luteolibacter sp.]
MNVSFSSQARKDLIAIHDFIARDSVHYAKIQTERLISRTEKASKMPTAGHPVPEYPRKNLREVHEGNYRIIYRYSSKELEVVTIVHMKRPLPPASSENPDH